MGRVARQMARDQGRKVGGAVVYDVVVAAFDDAKLCIRKDILQVSAYSDGTDGIGVTPYEKDRLGHARQVVRQVGIDIPHPACCVRIILTIGLSPVVGAELGHVYARACHT